MMAFIIEFRSGSYFTSLDADHGGTREQARRFATRKEADEFGDAHPWIWFNGGMVVEAQPPGAAVSAPAYRIVDGVAVPFPLARQTPVVTVGIGQHNEATLHRHELERSDGLPLLLYLPAGEMPTPEHCAAVERAMGGGR